MASDPEPLGRRDVDVPESADELRPDDTGTWVVTTRHTTHTFDLDRRTYRRDHGPYSPPMTFDGETVRFTRLVYPAVGRCHLVVYDDPDHPDLLGQWRKSSTITSITRQPGPSQAASDES